MSGSFCSFCTRTIKISCDLDEKIKKLWTNGKKYGTLYSVICAPASVRFIKKGNVMKKVLLALLLALSLVLTLALASCGGDSYDDSEEQQTVTPHPETEADETEAEETDSSLGIGVDTEEGWGEIHR